MKPISRSWSVIILLTAICLGQAQIHAADADAGIAASIAKSYIYSSYLKDDAVKIEVKDGTVLLTGQVSEASHKHVAQEVAASAAGVVQVDNQLVIKLEGSDKSDSWIRAKVRSVLELHRNVSDSTTQVDIKDGVITLRGEAINDVQRELATAYAGDIKEVVRVINVMTVRQHAATAPRPSEFRIDDASVTALVRSALLNHRSTSRLRTKVQVLDGEVSIAGIAQSAAEKSRVTQLVADLHGVTSVKNMMVIEDQ